MWLRRILGLCSIGLAAGILLVLFLPISVLFFIIAIILLIIGITWFFC